MYKHVLRNSKNLTQRKAFSIIYLNTKNLLTIEKATRQIKSEIDSSFSESLKHENFSKRHIGPNESQTNQMLKVLNLQSLEQLMQETVPKDIQFNKEQQLEFNKLGGPLSEKTALEYIESIAEKNEIYTNYIGCGFHPTFVPPPVLRNICENPGWYTSYTPYQSEISQGRLNSLLNFQTLISELTGLPYANASLLDEATSAAEAMYLAFNQHNGKKKTFFIAEDVFPFIKELIYTRAKFIGVEVSKKQNIYINT
jgi:glycine dehydrogenase